jgi:aspartokinase-like uncharacterized kinase
MKSRSVLFKIGGGILENHTNLSSTISQVEQLYNTNKIQKIVLIPGGGTPVNFIRKLYSELNFTEDVAHWMSIFSMNYNGIQLSEKFPHIKSIENSKKLKKESRSFCLFLPFQFLKKRDELPHSWEVTSDSIALYLTKKLGINKCILIKEVDGILNNNNQVIREINTSYFNNMRQSGKISQFEGVYNHLKTLSRPVDPYVIYLIEKYKMPCVILNGASKKHRILEFFDETISSEEKICTIIKSI